MKEIVYEKCVEDHNYITIGHLITGEKGIEIQIIYSTNCADRKEIITTAKKSNYGFGL